MGDSQEWCHRAGAWSEVYWGLAETWLGWELEHSGKHPIGWSHPGAGFFFFNNLFEHWVNCE